MHSRNLAILFAGICGYAERVGRQSWEQSQRMLRVHEALFDPAFRALGGRRIKQIGGVSLLSFESPTRAVLCAAALRERVAAFNARVPPTERLEMRAGLHLGEVRIERGDVFGEAVNVAARIESIAGPGEVLLGEALWLSMNRADVKVDELGARELKGVPEPVRILRLREAELAAPICAELGELPSPERVEREGEVMGHLRAALHAALRRAEEKLPAAADRSRVFIGAGVAAMVAIATAFFAIARLGARP